MDAHERRFISTEDRAYLDEIEVALVRAHGIGQERAGSVVQEIAAELNRRRMVGTRGASAALFPFGGAAGHAEALAALMTPPRGPARWSLAALAFLAAVAGLLGMRIVLGVVFRRFEPVRIGWTDATLAAFIVGAILLAARVNRRWARLGGRAWVWIAPVAGIAIGLAAVVLLRAVNAQRIFVTIPFWGAAAIAAACAALAWLLTWPGDREIIPP